MSRAHFRDSIQALRAADGALVPLAGATVTVRQTGTTAPIGWTMYNAAGQTLANPLVADARGVIDFYLDTDERVDLYATAPGYDAVTVTVDVISQATLTAPTITGATITSSAVSGGTIDSSTIAGATINSSNIQSPSITSPNISGATIVSSTLNTVTINNPTITNPTITGAFGVPLGSAAAPGLKVGTEPTGLYAQQTSSTNRALGLTVNGVYQVLVNSFDAAGTTQMLLGPKCVSLLPATDTTHNLGNTGQRWAVVYAANGTIQTSSKAAKEDWRPLDPARALAVAVATAIGSFRYRNAPEARLGFLAEDTDPLLTLDGRSADPQTTAALALCAVRALAERNDALERRLAALEGPGPAGARVPVAT